MKNKFPKNQIEIPTYWSGDKNATKIQFPDQPNRSWNSTLKKVNSHLKRELC